MEYLDILFHIHAIHKIEIYCLHVACFQRLNVCFAPNVVFDLMISRLFSMSLEIIMRPSLPTRHGDMSLNELWLQTEKFPINAKIFFIGIILLLCLP